MIKLGLVCITIALLAGCTSKESQSLMREYEKKQNYYKYLQKTEKVQFKEGNVTTLLVTATYMNKPTIDIDDTSDEVFLVGIYNDAHDIETVNSEELSIQLLNVKTKEELKEERDKKRAELKRKREKLRILQLKNPNATFKDLDDKKKKKKEKDKYLDPIDVKIVSKESPMLKGISFVSDWTQFYLISYKHIAGNRLLLQVKSKKSEMQLEKEKAEAKAKANLAKKKKKKSSKKKKKKKKKVSLYHKKTLSFAKVAKYAL